MILLSQEKLKELKIKIKRDQTGSNDSIQKFIIKFCKIKNQDHRIG